MLVIFLISQVICLFQLIHYFYFITFSSNQDCQSLVMIFMIIIF